jgi:hypothetical protein
MNKCNEIYAETYDSAYEADDEYEDINDPINDPIVNIDKQVFINIGIYMMELCDEPEDKMCRVLAELVALHGCKEEPTTQIIPHVGACRPPIKSASSGLFSLSSNETDDSVFRYYISDDEINIELT